LEERNHVFLLAAIMVRAIRALQKEWPEIVEDIRTGKLNQKITDPELRSEVEKILTPNAEQASRVEMECSKEDWAGIIPRLFPNAHYLECVTTGAMSQYAPALKHFAGHLPNVSTCYASSECNLFGINPNPCCLPEDVTYMLWPESAYFEFIPVDESDHSVQVLEACDLQVGKEYELLVTTPSGMFFPMLVFMSQARVVIIN
jgi:auxin responsive GH3 family protein